LKKFEEKVSNNIIFSFEEKNSQKKVKKHPTYLSTFIAMYRHLPGPYLTENSLIKSQKLD
jgi:hypothetical protein